MSESDRTMSELVKLFELTTSRSRARRRWSAVFISWFRPAIVTEFMGVLRNDFQWDKQQIQDVVRILVRLAEVVAPQIRLSVVMDDPSDDRILEYAAEGRANLIVSGDL